MGGGGALSTGNGRMSAGKLGKTAFPPASNVTLSKIIFTKHSEGNAFYVI